MARVYLHRRSWFTGGTSNLILDCTILDGNPADSALTETILIRQEELYDRPPRIRFEHYARFGYQ